jgi:heat shock protein HtpX
MFKRIALFMLTNILVMVTISIVINVLGIKPYMTAYGINYESLMIFCAIWGMGGAFISLLMSKQMAKWMMGVKIVDVNTRDPNLRELVNTVHRLSQAAHLPKMPEVGIYDSPEVNAFATGPSKSNSLVAVSTGLLQRMRKNEVEGVLGHEVAHIANGDMVTMTLIQGVVNAFVMFFARILAYAISNAMRSDNDRGPSYGIQMLLTIVFDIMFSILGSMVVAAFSRWREFRADRGSAQLAGREKMIAALEALGGTSRSVDNEQKAFASLKINGHEPKGLMALFMTHPSLSDRIERLRKFA